MLEFLRVQYLLGRVSSDQIAKLIKLGRISQKQAEEITGVAPAQAVESRGSVE